MKLLPISTVLIVLMGFSPLSQTSTALYAGELTIHHINVGQGDCTLIVGPDGTSVLIDAGENKMGNQAVVPYLKNLGIDSLDYMIATHLDSDHIGGLDEVINSGIDVRKAVFDHGGDRTTKTFDGYAQAAPKSTAKGRTRISPGAVLQLGDGAIATCVVSGGHLLGDRSLQVPNENDKSVGFLVEYGGFDYIITGDLGGGGGKEQKNLEIFVGVIVGDVDVLRVNHHGSSSSTCKKFLQQTDPEVAIISVGENNRHRHPTAEVLSLLSGITLYTTEEGVRPGGIVAGDIIVWTDGSSYKVEETSFPLDTCSTGTAQPITDELFDQLLPLSGTREESRSGAPRASKEQVDKLPGKFVASKQSNKYHKKDCRYATTINAANLISFYSPAGAESQGYTACNVCKPKGTDATIKKPTRSTSSGQCMAITKKGTRCKRKASPGSNYCWQHQK